MLALPLIRLGRNRARASGPGLQAGSQWVVAVRRRPDPGRRVVFGLKPARLEDVTALRLAAQEAGIGAGAGG
jgi:hypothetical protein